MNKFYFRHRGENFVIHAKDVQDAFNPWKRLFGSSNFSLTEFEKELIDEPGDSSNCLLLVGDSLTREEIRNLLNKKKIGLPVSKSIQDEKISEAVDIINLATSTPIIKRGRGRPRKVFIKEISETTMENYFL